MLPLQGTTTSSARNKTHDAGDNPRTCIISTISVVMMSFSTMCSTSTFNTSCLASITRFFLSASWWHRCMPHAASILGGAGPAEPSAAPRSHACPFPTWSPAGAGGTPRAAAQAGGEQPVPPLPGGPRDSNGGTRSFRHVTTAGAGALSLLFLPGLRRGPSGVRRGRACRGE